MKYPDSARRTKTRRFGKSFQHVPRSRFAPIRLPSYSDIVRVVVMHLLFSAILYDASSLPEFNV
jgi:hypothetical protein